MRASRRRDLNVMGPQRPETAPISVARQGPLTCPLATFAVAICNGSKTSTPAVRGANNWGVIQFDEEGRVIPTWEDDDDGDAA